MSVTPTTNYLSYEGLQKYDGLIKGYIADAEGKIKVANTHFTKPVGTDSATLESALAQLVAEQADAKIAVQETAGTDSDTFAKKYTLWTGDIKPEEADPYASATKLGEINIPKDFLIKKSEVKVVEEADKPVEGYKIGQKYIDFTVNAKDAADPSKDEHMYILVDDLVKPFTVKENATQVQVAISDENVISATLVDGGVDLDALANEVKADYAIKVTTTPGGEADAFAQQVVIAQGVDAEGEDVVKAILTFPKDIYVSAGSCEYLNAEAIAAITDVEGTKPTIPGYYIILTLTNNTKKVYVPVSTIASTFSVLNTHAEEGETQNNSVTLTKDTTDPTDAKLSAEITDAGVTTSKIANSAVTIDKLADSVLQEFPGVIPLTGDDSIAKLFE